MTTNYGGPDIDTSSLVNDDELDNFHQRHIDQHRGHTEELYAMARELHAETDEGISSSAEISNTRSKSKRTSRHDVLRASASRFYGSVNPNVSTDSSTTQSRRIPNCVWQVITSVLGVAEARASRVWIGTTFYILTLVLAFTFTFFGVWYTVYDIRSTNSPTTVHIGFVSLLIGFGWLCLGVYSFRLAGKLFENKNFAVSVRAHARTLFKVNAIVILIICGAGFTGLNVYKASDLYGTAHCHSVDLYPVVCHGMYIARAVFSVVAMVWNVCVGCVLLSVCRTHTVGIRRFILDLEADGQLYELYWREKLRRSKLSEINPDTHSILNNSDWFVWNDGDTSGANQALGLLSTSTYTSGGHDHVFNMPVGEPGPTSSRSHEVPHVGADVTYLEDLPDEPPIMTSEELLLCYWKISSRMRLTSRFLQRWLSSWMAFVLIWCADYVIYWLKHSPDTLSILEFIAPMVLLLVLCSAYAEANWEGQHMIRCICPTKERFGLLHFLNQQPLQMQTFGLSITYSAILTVILAFSVAFASRLILDEVTKV